MKRCTKTGHFTFVNMLPCLVESTWFVRRSCSCCRIWDLSTPRELIASRSKLACAAALDRLHELDLACRRMDRRRATRKATVAHDHYRKRAHGKRGKKSDLSGGRDGQCHC